MIKHPKTLQVGLVGPAESGKSTFLAANAKTPALVADADNRFDSVAEMMGKPPIYLSRRACNDPFTLEMELEQHGFSVNSIIFDAVSVMYSRFSRRASMGNRLTAEQRKEMGMNANKASDMVGKADMMAVIGNSTAYGADVFFVWHRNLGLDVENMNEKARARKYDEMMVEKDSISGVELDRLATSMNMRLVFFREGNVYKLRVESARDYAGSKANTGVIVTDYPGNFWRNGLARVLDLVYVNFKGQEDALTWAAQKLGQKADTLIDLYNDTKDHAKPKNSTDMWLAWVERIHGMVYGGQEKPAPKPVTETKVEPEKETAVEESPAPPSDPGQPSGDTDFDMLESAVPHVPEKGEDGNYHYADDSVVGELEEPYYLEYCRRVGRKPDDVERLRNAVRASKEHGKPYVVN